MISTKKRQRRLAGAICPRAGVFAREAAAASGDFDYLPLYTGALYSDIMTYMLDYQKVLNRAQYEAVTSDAEATLVVAGAGSGKTRAIIYRLAWLVERGVSPESILLLTFTRKAAREMLDRAAALMGRNLTSLPGGTFHSFAYGALRRYPPQWLDNHAFTLMDQADVTHAVRQCGENLKLDKKGRSFPKAQTVADILGKARNKEKSIAEIIGRECFHLAPYADDIEKIGVEYQNFRRQNRLMDYDDLLFELEDLLKNNPLAAERLRARYSHVLVDEYQDTNLVQARLVRLMAGEPEKKELSAKVMAVGDEAQSIYAFRGANVRNILDFDKIFPGAKLVRLEENYRSTQPILDVANRVLANARESFRKNLFTRAPCGEAPRLVTPLSDASQAAIVTDRILELSRVYPPNEIAVLFRSGFHSFPLENALRKAGVPFRKYGGLRFIEASHVKDLLAYARLAINPLDEPAFVRLASLRKGIGAKTAERLRGLLARGDKAGLNKAAARYKDFFADLNLIEKLKERNLAPARFLEGVLEAYRDRIEDIYPEDWPSRLSGLEELIGMAENYDGLEAFLADMTLDTGGEERETDQCVTLSTVHSAKGLEWDATLIIDLVEDRFPSRHSLASPEDFEEERRLFYVACTRARKVLDLYSPASIYNKGAQCHAPAAPSPFVRELDPAGHVSVTEKYGGVLEEKGVNSSSAIKISGAGKSVSLPAKSGYCRHRVFGRGKIIKQIDAEKTQVNFPGFGLKVILTDYLIPDE